MCLELTTINELLGRNFYIPYYQRGYRWTEQQVHALLDDIWHFSSNSSKSVGGTFYCLQPVVVKEKTWMRDDREVQGWEVIDGQQRLTTLHILISYLAKEIMKVDSLANEYQGRELYTIEYQTRENSKEFLSNIHEDSSNIDFYHMYEAYKCIHDWFSSGDNVQDRGDRNRFIDTLLGKDNPEVANEKSVKVIWYLVDNKEDDKDEIKDSIELFTRLNIGKIPLTNSELIKALFLSSGSFKGQTSEEAERRKLEISLYWDLMEQKLGNPRFWAFISNDDRKQYPTKIDILFDMFTNKKKNEKDPLYTFIKFLNICDSTENNLWKTWLTIENYFLTLCEWFESKDYYHKIGYIINVGGFGNNLRSLVDLSINNEKKSFEKELNEKIKKSLAKARVLEDLSYDTDPSLIKHLLTLFNVETIRNARNITEFYPFDLHKGSEWTLEHIHAQNSEGISQTNKDEWEQWLNYHKDLMANFDTRQLEENQKVLWGEISEDLESLNYESLTWETFSAISERVILLFSENMESTQVDVHALSNMALLSRADNAALNNAVFEAKRRHLMEIDMKGSYVPICTKRAFLKNYSDDSGKRQAFFWGSNDRIAYIDAIKERLRPYLPDSAIDAGKVDNV